MLRTASRKLGLWLQEEFRSERLLPGLSAGVLMGITEVIVALSLGSLIFSGDLTAYLPYGIGMALGTAAIMMLGTSLTSLVPGVIGSTQDTSTVILAVIAAGLAGTLSSAGAETILASVLVAIALSALLTGVFFLALGFFKMGRLVRFVPYPVVGGFLAGTGWLLVQGSFGVMTGHDLTLANLPALAQLDPLILWLPGVLFALVLFFGLRRIRHFLAMPGILLGAVVVFYLAWLVTGTSIERAIDDGFVLGLVAGEIRWQPLALTNLLAANWAAILGQGGNFAIVLILSVVGLLLNASALELAIRRDVDLNRELQSAGITNLLSGLGGGMVGYPALSLSTLSFRIGARGRLPGLVAGALCVALLWDKPHKGKPFSPCCCVIPWAPGLECQVHVCRAQGQRGPSKGREWQSCVGLHRQAPLLVLHLTALKLSSFPKGPPAPRPNRMTWSSPCSHGPSGQPGKPGPRGSSENPWRTHAGTREDRPNQSWVSSLSATAGTRTMHERSTVSTRHTAVILATWPIAHWLPGGCANRAGVVYYV